MEVKMTSLEYIPVHPRYAPISFDLLDEIATEGLLGRPRKDLEDIKADLDDFIAQREDRLLPNDELGTYGLAVMLRAQVNSALT